MAAGLLSAVMSIIAAMNTRLLFCSLSGLALTGFCALGADELLFSDNFAGKPGAGWSWVREDRAAWRIADGALEMRILPGNLWGRANDVKNVLVRAAPDTTAGPVEVSVSVTNRPTHQYEQADMAWYFDDSNMVKLGLELVDGKVCIVMGREQADATRTLAKIPILVTSVRLRLIVDGQRIRGQYRPAGSETWLDAAEGELPAAPAGGHARISLHCYQGARDAEHWARFSEFRVMRSGRP